MPIYSTFGADFHHASNRPRPVHGSDKKQDIEFSVTEQERQRQRELVVRERRHDVELAVEWGLVAADDAPRLMGLAESEYFEDEDEFRRTVTQPVAKESFGRLMRWKRERMEQEREEREKRWQSGQ